MKVLLAVFDLYRATGGGQTAYRAIIENRPQDEFYYLIRGEARDAPRPANAFAIPHDDLFRSRTASLAHSTFDSHLNGLYLETFNLAASVRRHLGRTTFDVVDVPDFHQYGLFIRAALADQGIGVGKVAIGLYGVLSNSFLTNWPIDGATDFAGRINASTANIPFIHAVERLQYSTADIPYTCVGRPYQDRWRGYADRTINNFDPMICVRQPSRRAFSPSPDDPVDLVFIGRRERIKGPDLFADLAAWVPPEKVGKIIYIGPDGPNSKQVSSNTFVDPIIRNRGLRIETRENVSDEGLKAVFAGRSLIVLPSRFDTLNFVALEALAHGCPVVVSRAAGVAAYMSENRPEVPIGVFDIDCARDGATAISDWLEDYDERRADLIARVDAGGLKPDLSSIGDIYEDRGGSNPRLKALVSELHVRTRTFNPPTDKLTAREQLRLAVRRVPTPIRGAGAQILARAKAASQGVAVWKRRMRPSVIRAAITRRLKAAAERASGVAVYALSEARRAENAAEARAHVRTMPERSVSEIESKIAALKQQIGERRVDRVTFFRELGRLERRAGKPMIATAYQLRIMRWLGGDVFGDLPVATATLRDNGYVHEAAALDAMYGPDPDAACETFLKDRFEALRVNPPKSWQKRDDRRPADRTPRLSIIVSLYNAENKLNLFLRMIAQDRMVRRGEAEIILVDSGSPTNEFKVFKEFVERHPLPVFYGRSQARETIQAAWNRGINEARGQYLTFLGVDEAITPFASDTLAAHLDANPGVDWVVSDTIVTNADKRQIYDSDVMKYDRKDFRDWSHYLDCTYLNYVGCMYRKSVHDRFGYYDETFGAAGDNEFKNRVLPHIRCAYIPKMLGIFNNFPEERATQSPRAELEETRSWYIHRTLPGMRYAFQNRAPAEAEALLAATLRYRKAYTGGHVSTDFDLARSVSALVVERGNDPKWTALHNDIGGIVAQIAKLESLDPALFLEKGPTVVRILRTHIIMAARKVKNYERTHTEALYLPEAPNYDIFNDNRYEQHYWCW
jgi:glycosyltransferase involved in cell wall biosynthesis